MAKKVTCNKELMQKKAREIIKKAGSKIKEYEKFLDFGEFGVVGFELPDIGCWLKLNVNELRFSSQEGVFGPHNIDHAYQQSALMALWVWWADIVESQQRKENKLH